MVFAEEAELSFLQKKCYGNVIFNGTFQITIKIFRLDPLIIATLKCSTKGAMTGAFRRTTCPKPPRGKTTTEIQF